MLPTLMAHSTQARKKGVLFIGAFQRPADGTVGGQLFACQSLLESPLSSAVQWHLVDSSQRSLPPPNILIRAWDAKLRFWKSVAILLRPGVKAGLVFSSFRIASLLEKMTICGLGGLWGKRMVVTFRSEIRPLGRWHWLLHPFLRITLYGTSQIICQSELAASELVRMFPGCRDKVLIISNWIAPEPYSEIARNRAIAVGNSKVTGEVKVLFLGWLERNKGIHDLLAAARKLFDFGLRFQIELCGSGSQIEPLQQQCRKLQIESQVHFAGWLTGAAKFERLAAADLLVLPSYSEGMPNAVLEAMAAGLPIIATRVGGLPALVDEGRTGILVEPGNVEELAGAIKQMVESTELRTRLGQAGAEKVRNQHSIDGAWKRIAQALTLPPH